MVAWGNKQVGTETNNSQMEWFLMGGSGDDNVLELDRGNDGKTLNILSLNCTLQMGEFYSI